MGYTLLTQGLFEKNGGIKIPPCQKYIPVGILRWMPIQISRSHAISMGLILAKAD
jgi:hypothetical protein